MPTIEVKRAKTMLQKLIGLMYKRQAYPLIFETRWGIHTFGLQFPIDVVVLDRSNRVQKLHKNLKPNRVFFWPPKYSTILELPEGMINTKNIQVGTHLTLLQSDM